MLRCRAGGSEPIRGRQPQDVPANPEKIIDEPAPSLIAEGRCGRWRRDTTRTQSGRPTRKQAALAEIEAGRGAGKSEKALAALARRLCAKGLKDGARCRLTVKERGAPCKKLHGGKTPRGVDSPQWKHGEYSIVRYLRPDQKEAYDAWLNDPKRFAHSRQGAALEVLLVNQWARLRAPSLAEWKLISDGWEKLQEAGRLAATGKEADKKKATDLQRDGLAMIGQGVSGYDAEVENADAAKAAESLLIEQRKVASAENIRARREQEVITLQQHVAQRAREIELFWQAIEGETRGMKDRDAKLVRGALLAGVAAWREEGDRWTAAPVN